MSRDAFILILVVSGINLLVSIIVGIYHAWRRARHGPSLKEFNAAALTFTQFIAQHNRTHPQAKITDITISADQVAALFTAKVDP